MHSRAPCSRTSVSCGFLRSYVLGLGTTRGRLLAKLDQAKFRSFMSMFKFPESTHRDIDAVHMMFDDEKTGLVPLRDMINAFAQVLTTSIEERASFYFDVYDLDGSGSLDKNEVRACDAVAHGHLFTRTSLLALSPGHAHAVDGVGEDQQARCGSAEHAGAVGQRLRWHGVAG